MTRAESERIEWGPEPGQAIGGIGTVRIVARCRGDAKEVLNHARQVMRVVTSPEERAWPGDEEWFQLLPDWFVAACGPEEDDEAIAKVLLAEPEARRKLGDEPWSVGSWVHWFRPENRSWYWWDAVAADRDTLVVAIEVSEWPFPWAALKWLLKASGAESVEAEA